MSVPRGEEAAARHRKGLASSMQPSRPDRPIEEPAPVRPSLDERVDVLAATVRGHGLLLERLNELNQRLTTIQRTLQALALPEGGAAGAVPAPRGGEGGSGAGWAAFYAAFEDRFRGSREEIRQRQAVHLDRVLGQAAGLAELPVLDLGCGRGEWLELLREHGVRAVGIDTNRVFLAENAARGLEVIEAEALDHLRACADGSARAVTGFHIIEHLPFDLMRALLDQCLRVLAEGGLVLFETPNPENLITAARNFYYDPTHVRPIAPELAAFLLQAHGFREVEIVRLHPVQGAVLEEVPPGFLRELLFGPQDYAVLGYR